MPDTLRSSLTDRDAGHDEIKFKSEKHGEYYKPYEFKISEGFSSIAHFRDMGVEAAIMMVMPESDRAFVSLTTPQQCLGYLGEQDDLSPSPVQIVTCL